jgi:ABC-type sugar transport system permease subunit
MAVGRTRTRVGLMDRQRRRVLWMLLPAVIIYALLMLYPALSTVWVAFTNWNGVTAPTYAGGSNFSELLHDSALKSAVTHTVQFVVIGGVILFPLAFFFAYATDGTKFGKTYRFFILLPIALSVTTAALLWKFALNPNFGFVDAFLRDVGLTSAGHFQWLGETSTAMLMVVLATIWSGAGIWMLFLASAMAQVSPELREAAALDGASRTQIFWLVVLPIVWPVTRSLILLWVIQAAQAFGFIVAMTGGGPLGSTQVIGTYLYSTAFTDNRYGYASAIAVALALVVLLISGVSQLLVRRKAAVGP